MSEEKYLANKILYDTYHMPDKNWFQKLSSRNLSEFQKLEFEIIIESGRIKFGIENFKTR